MPPSSPVSWPLKMDGPSAYSHMLRLTVSARSSPSSAQRRVGHRPGLMNAVRDHALAARYHRIWLTMTNDNARAFRFYQLWGMDLCAFYRHGARRSEVKPSLPERGADGILLDHELEFETLLGVTNCSAVSLRES